MALSLSYGNGGWDSFPSTKPTGRPIIKRYELTQNAMQALIDKPIRGKGERTIRNALSEKFVTQQTAEIIASHLGWHIHDVVRELNRTCLDVTIDKMSEWALQQRAKSEVCIDILGLDMCRTYDHLQSAISRINYSTVKLNIVIPEKTPKIQTPTVSAMWVESAEIAFKHLKNTQLINEISCNSHLYLMIRRYYLKPDEVHGLVHGFRVTIGDKKRYAVANCRPCFEMIGSPGNYLIEDAEETNSCRGTAVGTGARPAVLRVEIPSATPVRRLPPRFLLSRSNARSGVGR